VKKDSCAPKMVLPIAEEKSLSEVIKGFGKLVVKVIGDQQV